MEKTRNPLPKLAEGFLWGEGEEGEGEEGEGEEGEGR